MQANVNKPEPFFRSQPENYSRDFFPGTPSWMMRWGVTMVLCLVVIALILGWLIKYPDSVGARFYLTTEHPPQKIAAPINGRIEFLGRNNKSEISKGELLAVMQSASAWKEVLALDSFLLSANGDVLTQIPNLNQLGAIQASFASWEAAAKSYFFHRNRDWNARRIQNLKEQINQLKNLNVSLTRQEAFSEKEVKIIENKFLRDSQLQNSGVISANDLEESQKQYLAKLRELEELRSRQVENSLRINQMEGEILSLGDIRSEDLKTWELEYLSATSQLRGEIDRWKEQFLLTAEIDGVVNISRDISLNTFLEEGDIIATILPDTTGGELIARALVPFANSGKIEVGMTALLKVDGFPFREYGVVKARVDEISLISREAGYEMILHPGDDLTTTYGKTLQFREGMEGTAEIITRDRRVIERFFDRIRSMVKNR